MIKVHIGCGARDFGPDWFQIDGGDFRHTQYHNIKELPYDDNVVDLIYASHVIEYFDRDEVTLLLDEWYRVMKPGAVLRLAVPDFEKIANLYASKQYGLNSFLGMLYGKMPMGKVNIYHKTVYDLNSIKILLMEIGFKNIARYDWRKTEHAHIDDHSQAYLPHMDKENGTLMSLNVECIK